MTARQRSALTLLPFFLLAIAKLAHAQAEPSPELGVRAIGESNSGRVNIALDGATTADLAAEASFAVRRTATTPGYDGKTLKIDIRASSGPGNINIAAIPAAPLVRPNQ